MIWPKGIRETGLALLTAGVTLGLFMLDNSGLIRSLETASLDLRFRIRGAVPPAPEVAVILIDDRSLDALGRWPLSRRLLAKAIGALDDSAAKVIAFDLLFIEPEQPISPPLQTAIRKAEAALPGEQHEALRKTLHLFAEDDPDGEFERAIKASGKVFLPIAFAFDGPPRKGPNTLSDAAFQRFDKTSHEPEFALQPVSANVPLDRLATAAEGLGHVNIAFDRDGAPRYDYVVLPFEGDFLPSLPLRLAAAYLGIPWDDIGLTLGEGVSLGDTFVPTDSAMRVVINYRGPRGTIPTFSFVDLVAGRLPAAKLAGRVVLIGASLTGLPDANRAPFDNTPMPGTERLANIVDNILHRNLIRESPPPWPEVVIGLVLVLAMLIGVATAILPTRIAVLAGATGVLVWWGGVQVAFAYDLWLPLVTPTLSLIGAVASVLWFRYSIVDRQRRQIHSAFGHYLAPDLVNTLASHPERLRLGGETRPLTLMFCDIRGFTAISETFKANPEGLGRLINQGFLSPMTELILARRGTIDKYMGDCIMAFWNAPLDDPDHADHACSSALAMIDALGNINARLAAEAAAEGRRFEPLRIGVGLNTGDCIVGNMGSTGRFAYTAMGDAVNLASRLEGQTKPYCVDIIIGEDTHRAAANWATLELDLIAVKGKQEAVRIYALLGDDTMAQSREFHELKADQEAMLQYYGKQDWAGARAALDRLRQHAPTMDPLFDLYEERICFFEANPPGPSWDGIFVALTK